MSGQLDGQKLLNRSAIIGSRELLRRMVATGHVWPVTMQAHIDRHGLPECLRPKAPTMRGRHERPTAKIHDRARGIIERVADKEGLTLEELLARDHSRPLVSARRRAIRLLHRLGFSLNSIGRAMSRDHSTISAALFGKGPREGCRHR